MFYRQLGKTGLKVSVLGLGCGRLGSVTQARGNEAALRLVACALDHGVTFFDTADIYGQGASERLLAKALKGRGDQVVVASKAGFCLGSLGLAARYLKPLVRRLIRLNPKLSRSVQKARATQQRQDFSAPYLTASIEASLRRLERDRIEVFFLHSPPSEVLQRGEVFETLAKLKAQGKLGHCGVSTRTLADAKLCLEQEVVEVMQVECNALTARTNAELLPAAHARGVGIVARQALAGGLLLRGAADVTADDCAEREWSLEDARNGISRLAVLAGDTGATRTQAAAGFVAGLGGISSVLIGTTNLQHLEEVLTLPPSWPVNPGAKA